LFGAMWLPFPSLSYVNLVLSFFFKIFITWKISNGGN